jgi:hypothetical protein
MSTARGILIGAILLLCAADPARGQAMPGDQPATTAGTGHGAGMDGMMKTDSRGMMGSSGMMDSMMPMTGMPRHLDGWLAFLRTELKITDAQAGVWSDFAEAIHVNAARMGESHASMSHQDAASPNLPDRLLAQEQMMAGRLTAMRRMRETIDTLYAVLSDAQKKMADELLSPRGMM